MFDSITNTMKQGAVMVVMAAIVATGLYLGHLDEQEPLEVASVQLDPVSEAFDKVQMAMDDIVNSKSINEANKEFMMKQQQDFLTMLGKACASSDKVCFLNELNRQHRFLRGQEKIFTGK